MPFPQKVRLLFGSLSPSKFGGKISSFADPGCFSRILDPGSNFFPSQIPDPGSKFFPFWILDPGSASTNLSILTKKNGFSALRHMIRVFHPGSGSGSGSWLFTYPESRSWIPDPESRGQKGTGSQIPDPVRNTGDFGFAQAVGGSVGYWLSTGAAVLTHHSMDQLSEAFMCKKEFSLYFILTVFL
jgi:hypothetical protein